jgi:hypothetical protein
MDSNQQKILIYLAKLEKQLIKIYGSTYKAAVEINEVRQSIESGENFTWSGNRQAAAHADKLLQQLSEKVQTIIANGIVSCYRQGERYVKGDVIKALGVRSKEQKKEVTDICDAATDQLRKQGVTALERMNERRGGIRASSNIWKQNAKHELEIIIQNGIKEGKSPQEVAHGIRPYLLDQHRYEKSVYNPETGKLERSDAAKDYHPGHGVYRSSFKNAFRMARTEMTQAYRAAEWQSYQNNPLVTAYEIKLSSNHTTTVNGKTVPLTDICDKLAGVYPKTFKWEGWHPQCRCYMVPVTVGKSDFRNLLEARKEDREAKRDGKEATAVKQMERKASKTPFPKKYTDWLEDNKERIAYAKKNGGSIPQWIKENEGIQTASTIVITKPTSPNMPNDLLTEKQKQEWIENEQKVEQLIGVIRGELMNFEQANEQRGNPHFVSGSGDGYTINCQSCVVANELRRRGYDVEALNNTNRKGNAPFELSKDTANAWIDTATGNKPTKTNCSASGEVNQSTALIDKIDNATSTPGRYHIDWGWKGKRSGHIITMERLKDGTARYYDPQNGKTSDIKDFVARIDKYSVNVLRIDDKMINTDIIKGIVAKKGTTKAITDKATFDKKQAEQKQRALKSWYDIYNKTKYTDEWKWYQKKLKKYPEFAKELQDYIKVQEAGGTAGTIGDEPISPLPNDLRQRRAEIVKIAVRTLTNKVFHHPELKGDIRIYKRGINEWLNQPNDHIASKNELLLNIGEVIEKGVYKGYNTYKGHKSHIVEITFEGKKAWVVITDYPGRGLAIHGLSERETVLKGLKKD